MRKGQGFPYLFFVCVVPPLFFKKGLKAGERMQNWMGHCTQFSWWWWWFAFYIYLGDVQNKIKQLKKQIKTAQKYQMKNLKIIQNGQMTEHMWNLQSSENSFLILYRRLYLKEYKMETQCRNPVSHLKKLVGIKMTTALFGKCRH